MTLDSTSGCQNSISFVSVVLAPQQPAFLITVCPTAIASAFQLIPS